MPHKKNSEKKKAFLMPHKILEKNLLKNENPDVFGQTLKSQACIF